jgi:hypothetical protein
MGGGAHSTRRFAGRAAHVLLQKRTIEDIKKMYDNPTHCASGNKLFCDLALVELNQPSTKEDLDLANSQVMSEWGVGTATRAYGYGKTSFLADEVSPHLKRGSMNIASLEADHHLMTAWGPLTSTCAGDSGGPLVVSTSNGPRIVGILIASLAGCPYGGSNLFIKVGYRGSTSNSRPFMWVTSTI